MDGHSSIRNSNDGRAFGNSIKLILPDRLTDVDSFRKQPPFKIMQGGNQDAK